jgi:hypothetical protein
VTCDNCVDGSLASSKHNERHDLQLNHVFKRFNCCVYNIIICYLLHPSFILPVGSQLQHGALFGVSAITHTAGLP